MVVRIKYVNLHDMSVAHEILGKPIIRPWSLLLRGRYKEKMELDCPQKRSGSLYKKRLINYYVHDTSEQAVW